jgi:hypothetical protein
MQVKIFRGERALLCLRHITIFNCASRRLEKVWPEILGKQEKKVPK